MTPRQAVIWVLQSAWVYSAPTVCERVPVRQYHIGLHLRDWHARGRVDRLINDKGLSRLLHRMMHEGLIVKRLWMWDSGSNLWQWKGPLVVTYPVPAAPVSTSKRSAE